ncbi:serine/threonine-protein kinase PCRK1-like [Juglans microcarpa x Juglans regia]|uniref:serine/threonine-protein kinase PCRK1-like n=1 Tax=Juglans microcarpa x Juglans regia TaxID=2249226 RepID=UPI001B7EC4B2|nr:serine/threonine-protein kinase PCRK1-like [Juglans microcarpa x Juglans regia]XP_041001544.1 serine/threonine-protein kinase PCRK1-like [Juglans microcarpa x Juglans regia]XP_041001545.1 serine/threonine-protein kinase PCRK1-like [Juglans microcarpa x Juglans regia]XP_041001546.1 serine/threonine-protein kinase PCRK1-like [Juglans microcarpa x Juglans regia]XP_041001547.1 serine/threonine-protein kinase PCRK1-like [Juglans microcarpa x Juglans regia]XP_041001548.1 serine/threonine-protein 
MKCFLFSNKGKHDEPTTTKLISIRSTSKSMSADQDMRRSGSEFNSQNVSELSTASSVKTFAIMSQRQSNLREFTFSELKTATKNFSRSVMLGEGGFGGVYRGVIRSTEDPHKKIDVAVKQLSRRGLQGHKEWVNEVNVLGVVQHPNLVKLLGYCAEDDERGIQRLLVYEYMPNRSVQDHLSNRFQSPLSWTTRMRIAHDAARGLTYLHEGMDFQIIFRDFKSSNILLDEDWNAKLSDFGLARLGPSDGLSHVSTAVVGTIGYAAPEYIQTGHLTSKIDVWGYGVFLYELITGRRPFDGNRPKNEQKMLDWVKSHLSNIRKFELILDPRLQGKYSLKCAQKLATVANRCLVRQPKSRPTMSEVLKMVSGIMETTDIGSPQLPIKSLAAEDDDLLKSKRQRLKRLFLDPLIRGKGLLRRGTSRPKVVKTRGDENEDLRNNLLVVVVGEWGWLNPLSGPPSSFPS